ncbi:MAG: hypothetical protein ACRETB_11970 [Steroidobacteraceae bacterium]
MKSFTKFGLLAAAMAGLAGVGVMSVASAQDNGGAQSRAAAAPDGQWRGDAAHPGARIPYRAFAQRGFRHRASRWRHGRRAGVAGVFLRQIHALDLSQVQRQQIRGILRQARSSHKSARPHGFDLAVIGDPGNPGFARAVAAAKARAADRIERRSQIATQVYQVLTPVQRHDLATLLAADNIRLEVRRARMQQMRQQMQKRRAEWLQRHPGGPAAGPGGSSQG